MIRRVLTALVLGMAMVPDTTSARPPTLHDLFRTEIELAAAKLRMKPADLDADVALALAVTGVTWEPVSDGHALLVRERKRIVYAPYEHRLAGYRSASRVGDPRQVFAFALSIVLDSPPNDQSVWHDAYRVVSSYGTELDRVLVGILGAGEKVPLLPLLGYAAADLVVSRPDTEHLPLYTALAASSDAYLRSRGVAGIAILACSERAAASGRLDGLDIPLRAFPISAVQRGRLLALLEEASRDRSYRVRGAAALGLGLSGHERAREILQRLAQDRAYLLMPGSTSATKRVLFPVRATAEAVLTLLGYPVRRSGGEFTARTVREVIRGGKDVTRDRSSMRRAATSPVRFNEWGW